MTKILVSKRRAIGDTILLEPVFDIIRRRFSDAEITVLVNSAAAELLQHHPVIDTIWRFQDRSLLGWWWKIRNSGFDYYFDFHSTGRTRFLHRFCGIDQAYSHRHDLATERTHSATVRPNALQWDQWFLRDLPLAFAVPEMAVSPRIYLKPEESQWAEGFWRKRGWQSGDAVMLGVGASRPTKRWPAEHFAQFATLVRDRLEKPVALIVSNDAAEREYAGRILDGMRTMGFQAHSKPSEKSFLIHESNLSLRQYAAILQTACAYVGNDSGPKHLAAAVGCKTMTFFGPEDPVEWHPYTSPQHQYLFQPGLACRREDDGRWCSIASCIEEKHRCMVDLQPDEAFTQFQKLIGSSANG